MARQQKIDGASIRNFVLSEFDHLAAMLRPPRLASRTITGQRIKAVRWHFKDSECNTTARSRACGAAWKGLSSKSR